MKYFITGVEGQLGYDIKKYLERTEPEAEILAPTLAQLDITDYDATEAMVEEFHPDVIFHCAAYTAVDKAEEEPEMADMVNFEGTANVVDAAENVDAKVIYISTDYVFDGTKPIPYEVDDEVNPLSVYGRTKRRGENYIETNYEKYFIVRTAWVFGINGNNFVKTMLRLSDTHGVLKVVDDQIGTPTYTVDLAELLVAMSHTEKYGIYHATNSGECSWAEFAAHILMRTLTMVHPTSTEDYAKQLGRAQAPRPMHSVLSKQKLLENDFKILPDWRNAVDRFIAEMKDSEICDPKSERYDAAIATAIWMY